MVGALFLTVGFGVGHLIAKNEKVDLTPVITVPVELLPSKTTTFTNIDITDSSVRSISFETNNTNSGYALHCYYDLDFQNDSLTVSYYIRLFSTIIYTSSTSSNILASYDTDLDIRLMKDFDVAVDLTCTGSNGSYSYSTVVWFFYGYENAYMGAMQNVRLTDLDASWTYSSSVTNSLRIDGDSVSMPFLVYINDYFTSSNETYQLGYNDGYNAGILNVLNNLSSYNLYDETTYLAYGQSEYQRGYDAHASVNVLSVSAMIREIFRAPVSMFQNAFNFVLPLPDGTSLNVGGILTFFLTIGIALTIVSLISKIGGK